MAEAFACNILAINATQRPRYNELVSRLRSSMYDRRELPDGYRYSLRPNEITFPEVAEWITLERLCCPFLTFHLEAAGDTSCIAMCGPEGAKAILREAFPDG